MEIDDLDPITKLNGDFTFFNFAKLRLLLADESSVSSRFLTR